MSDWTDSLEEDSLSNTMKEPFWINQFTKMNVWLNRFTRRRFTFQHYERTILNEPIHENERPDWTDSLEEDSLSNTMKEPFWINQFTKMNVWLNRLTRGRFTFQHYGRTILNEPIHENERPDWNNSLEEDSLSNTIHEPFWMNQFMKMHSLCSPTHK